jgi:hypothetical protein
MSHKFRPSFGSLLGSLAYAASPAIVVGVVHYLKGPNLGVLIWIASALMLIFAFVLCLQAVFVHLVRLEISPSGIRVAGGLSGVQWLRWEEIVEATLRERRNPVSRTDHLLILKSQRAMLNYPLSVLSQSDETAVLDELRRRTRLVVIQDRAAI